MNCPRCDQPIEPGATFCGNCGEPVRLADDTPVPLASPSGPATAEMPDYAIANPAEQKSETKAMAGLVMAILGIPGALVPFLGLALGAAGLVLGTMTHATARKTVSTLSIVFAAIAILASIGSYAYSYKTLSDNQLASNSPSTTTSQNNGTTSGPNAASTSKSNGTVRTVDTPCYKIDLPQLVTLDNANGSCALKTYDTASTANATNIYTVDVVARKDITEANFAETAKDTLGKSLKANLPGLVVSSEKATTFANSPAYMISGKYQGTIGVQLMFILHPVAHGENIFVIVHGLNDGVADTTVLEKNWIWK